MRSNLIKILYKFEFLFHQHFENFSIISILFGFVREFKIKSVISLDVFWINRYSYSKKTINALCSHKLWNEHILERYFFRYLLQNEYIVPKLCWCMHTFRMPTVSIYPLSFSIKHRQPLKQLLQYNEKTIYLLFTKLKQFHRSIIII